MEFAESEFLLSAPQEDKKPLRSHLESLWRQSGEQPEQLKNAPELPKHAAHIWAWFIELNRERGNNGMTANRITAENVRDFCWFNGVVMERWERQAIRAVDFAWMESQRHD